MPLLFEIIDSQFSRSFLIFLHAVSTEIEAEHESLSAHARIRALVTSCASAYQRFLVVFDRHRLLFLLLCFLVVIVSAALVPHSPGALLSLRDKCTYLNLVKLRIRAAVEDTLLPQHTAAPPKLQAHCCLLCSFQRALFHNTVTSNGSQLSLVGHNIHSTLLH
jgi:hypothetical protein